MKQMDMRREDAFAALQQSYQRACSTVELLAEEAARHGLWEQAGFGERLSDLYLRLKRGPVRAVIMGQTSSGKSTLINALTGSIIAPESADACSPIPICFISDRKAGETHITYYDKLPRMLPQEKYANPTSLLQWHHDSGKLAEDHGTRPFVHTVSETFPQLATLIDSPGLNANSTDTDKLYALFDPPSYATADEPDLPELVLYISTAGGNLSEEEMKSLKRLLDKGVDPRRILLVHNELCADLEGLQADQFERTDDAARNGLAESLRALMPSSIPDVHFMDMEDSSSVFDAFFDDAFSQDVSASDEDEADAHIVSVNALFARVFYAGAYNPMANLITGATEKQYRQLQKAKKNPKQERVMELCAAWRQQGHADYQPLLHLRDVINEQAMSLTETADLGAALRAVKRLGDELIAMRIRQLTEEAERDRKPVLKWVKRLDELRSRLNKKRNNLPERIAKRHGQYASRLDDILWKMMEDRGQRLGDVAEGIAAAGTETQADRFLHGFRDSEAISFAGKLTSGLLNALANKNWLKDQFNTLLERSPCFTTSGHGAALDRQLFLAYQKPEGGQDAFAALESICKEIIVSLNQQLLRQDDESVDAVQRLLEEYGSFLTATLKGDAAEIRRELSSYCQDMQREAWEKDRQMIDALMKQQAFSSAVSAQSGDQMNGQLPEQVLACYGSVMSALRAAMANPIRETEQIARQIHERYHKLGTQVVRGNRYAPEVNLKNVREMVFRQVICPTLEQVVLTAAGVFDTSEISAQMDKLKTASQEYASQALEPAFSGGFELIHQCHAALREAMAPWRDPNDDEDVKRLIQNMAQYDRSIIEV